MEKTITEKQEAYKTTERLLKETADRYLNGGRSEHTLRLLNELENDQRDLERDLFPIEYKRNSKRALINYNRLMKAFCNELDLISRYESLLYSDVKYKKTIKKMIEKAKAKNKTRDLKMDNCYRQLRPQEEQKLINSFSHRF